MIKTLSGLPESFNKHVDVTANDWEFDVVARNAVILLFVFASLDDMSSSHASYGSVAEALIHLWYSAFVLSTFVASLKDRVGTLLQDSCTHTIEAAHDGMIRKTWTVQPGRSLDLGSLP